MEYMRTELMIEFEIKQIVSVHYFEFARGFVFSGERHNFWEFVYVDKGEVEIVTDNQTHHLKQGEMIFHKPNEFHSIWVNSKPPNLIGLSFDCRSTALNFLENKIFSLDTTLRNTLSDLLCEAFNAFQSPMNDPETYLPLRKENALFGSEQMVKILLERLLIQLIRLGKENKYRSKLSVSVKEQEEADIAGKLIEYMERNINSNLTLEDLCAYSNFGKTQLQTIFKNRTGVSIIKYFHRLKIDLAKMMIREKKYNFSEISKQLGFSSVHYFSRCFNNVVGMPPSEYAKSVKSRVVDPITVSS